jgi:hypothetical protein
MIYRFLEKGNTIEKWDFLGMGLGPLCQKGTSKPIMKFLPTFLHFFQYPDLD